jgi:hypothetical protein
MSTVKSLARFRGENQKNIKVFVSLPDYYDRDSNSMDMKITKFLILFSIIGLILGLFLRESPVLLSGQVKKSCYLAFHSPPKLNFHEVSPSADRLNLLTLGNPLTTQVQGTADEANSTTEVSEFPLTSYGDDDSAAEINNDTDMQDPLPPSDPFIGFELESTGVDSTDQLIQLFENLEKSGNPSSRVSVDFIPPYSTDSGNFRLESSASYKRRVR